MECKKGEIYLVDWSPGRGSKKIGQVNAAKMDEIEEAIHVSFGLKK